MKQFVKDNIVLVLGISLPILLVLLFAMASIIPQYFVDNPKYDVLFTDRSYNQLQFRVVDGKITLYVEPVRYTAEVSIPKLYRYSAATGKVEEVTFKHPDLSYLISKTPYNPNGVNTNVVIDPNQLPSPEQAQNAAEIATTVNTLTQKPMPQTLPIAELAGIKIDNSLTAPDGYSFTKGGYRSGGLFLFDMDYRENDKLVLSKGGRRIAIDYPRSSETAYYDIPHFIGWVIP